jgi:hypothetical protein
MWYRDHRRGERRKISERNRCKKEEEVLGVGGR